MKGWRVSIFVCAAIILAAQRTPSSKTPDIRKPNPQEYPAMNTFQPLINATPIIAAYLTSIALLRKDSFKVGPVILIGALFATGAYAYSL